MIGRVLIAGLLGLLVSAIWLMLVNGLMGLESDATMMKVADETALHAELGKQAGEPGGYIVNPEMAEPGRPPEGPVYSVQHSGLVHNDAGMLMLVGLVRFYLIVVLAAWLFLWLGADRGSYGRRLLFFVVLGLLVVLSADLPRWNIGGLPAGTVLMQSARNLVAWLLTGLVLAAWLRPRPAD